MHLEFGQYPQWFLKQGQSYGWAWMCTGPPRLTYCPPSEIYEKKKEKKLK